MKLLDPIAKALGYERRKPTALEREYSAASVWPGQQYNFWNADLDIEEAARRMTQFVELCARRKAVVCADQALRLYVRKGMVKSERARRQLGIRATTKRSAAYLRDPIRGAGRKVAMFAEQGDLEEVTSHPALTLLHNPNHWTRCTEFFRSIYYTLDYAGNFFAQHDGDGSKPPTTLIVMTPQYTRVVPSAETFISEYRYGQYHAHQQILMPDEVLHLRQLPHPLKPWIGMPTIKAMLIEADLDNATSVGELAMQRNGSRPDYLVMLPPEAGPEQIKQAQAALDSEFRGPQQRGKPRACNAATIEPLQFTPREMESPILKKDCVQRILACEGVPESEIFMNDAHEASARTGSVQFLRNIRTTINMVGEFMSASYLPLFGIGEGEMVLAYDDPVPVDEAAATTAAVAQYAAGIITLNEARDELGLEPVPDGDDFKADPALIAAENDNEPDAKDDRDPRKDKSLRIRKDTRQPPLPDADAKTVAKLERAVRRWIASIASFLGEEVTAGVVNSLDRFRPDLEKVAAPYIADLFADGFDFVAEGEPFTPYAAAEEYAERHVVQLAKAETETIQADLQEAISTSVANGQTLDEATGNVAKALNDESGYRAERIARTESSRSMQEGMRTEWKAQGVTKVLWDLAPNACPLCTALAAKCNANGGTPIDGTILNVGDSINYGDGKTYTNKYLPLTTAQGHPNCRCSLRAVIA